MPPYRIKNMMPGMIMLWYGSVATIPSGWALCDGNNNTPDLREKFVLCAKLDVGPGIKPGTTGGSINHDHDFTGDGHAHDLVVGNDIDDEISGGDLAHTTSLSPASGTTDQVDGRPPWHALCYIMKTPIP